MIMIHIAVSFEKLSNDYSRHVGVTLVSLLEHCSSPVTIHILYDEKLSSENIEISEFNKACFQKIADKYRCNILFHHVEVPEWCNNITNVHKFTRGALFRLKLPELLPGLDKIIYFDCDTIILIDVTELWNINIDGKYVAAALDQGVSDWSKDKYIKNNRSMRNISLTNYFNSGVLLLNLSELRKISFTEKAWKYLKENPDAIFPDQNALNYLCQNNFIKLDGKFNNIAHLKEINEDCIMHLCGGPKPWIEYSHPYNIIYWEYLRKTPWGEDKEMFYKYQTSVVNISTAPPLLEQDFFQHIQGTKWQKVRNAGYFLRCFLKQLIKYIYHLIIKD